MENENLKKLRSEIDQIDEEICSLLKRRFSVCEKIKTEKNLCGLSVADKNRESAVYEHIGGLFGDERQKTAAVNVYKEVVKNCKDLQK